MAKSDNIQNNYTAWLTMIIGMPILVFCILLIGAQKTYAITGDPTTVLPNNGTPDSYNHTPWLVVARPGTNGMNAAYSYSTLYVPESYSQITITVESACDGSASLDKSGWNNNTTFYSRSTNGSANPVIINSTNATTWQFGGVYNFRCNGVGSQNSTVTISLPGSLERKVLKTSGATSGYTVYKEVIVAAATNISISSFYENYFAYRLNLSDAFITYASTGTLPAGDYTGIGHPRSPFSVGPPDRWGTEMTFATTCDAASGNITANIQTFDNDYNDIQGSSAINIELWSYDRDTSANGRMETRKSLTGGDDVFENWNVTINKNKIYKVVVNNILDSNTIQIRLPYSQLNSLENCEDPPSQMTCENFSTGARSGNFQEIRFNIRNRTNFNWVSGTTGSNPTYDIGVVDTDYQYHDVNGPETRTAFAGGVAAGPPDHQSAAYIRNSVNGINNDWHRAEYNRNTAGGSGHFVERYGTTANVNSGSTRNFSVWVMMPATEGSSKTYGIRMLARGQAAFPFAWMGWYSSNNCEFTVTRPITTLPLTCQVSGITADVGLNFGLTISFTNPNPVAVGVTGATWNITPSTGVTVSSGVGTATAASPLNIPPGSTRSMNSSVTTEITIPGSYTANWPHTDITTNVSGTAPSAACTGSGAADVVAKPYARFYGNDVVAGGAYEGGVVVSAADALGYGDYGGTTSYDHDNYSGTAAQLAIFATGQINGVLPGSQTSRSATHAFGFANNDPSRTTDSMEFGGGFGASMFADDYPGIDTSDFTGLGGNTLNLDDESRQSGEYRRTGVARVRGNLEEGERFTLHASGDVTINENITYSGAGTWSSLSDIPLLRVYTEGNIYIQSDVTEIAGLFAAAGKIYTCIPDATFVEPATFPNSGCENRLQIWGGFVAPEVHLWRTNGTMADSSPYEAYNSATIAESFYFSPEVYLALLSASGTNNGGAFDSLLSLPPAF